MERSGQEPLLWVAVLCVYGHQGYVISLKCYQDAYGIDSLTIPIPIPIPIPILYPSTSQQVATTDNAKRHVGTVLRSITKENGILGLWRGFWTVAVGIVPSQMV